MTTTPHPIAPQFLRRPTVEFEEYEDRILCAYVKLQDRKAVRDVQPNPDVAVYFYLDDQGFPVGIKFYEPVSGLAAFEVVEHLICGPSGTPVGIDQHVECHFLTGDELCAAVAACHAALRRLSGVGQQQTLFDKATPQQPA